MSDNVILGPMAAEKLSPSEIKTIVLNQAVADIVRAYLEYTSKVVGEALSQSGYDAQRFKEVGDELIITPEELIALIDRLQIALSEI